MTKTARVYGGSLYDLAAEEKLDGQIMEQMIAIRQIFRENPGYLKLLGEQDPASGEAYAADWPGTSASRMNGTVFLWKEVKSNGK